MRNGLDRLGNILNFKFLNWGTPNSKINIYKLELKTLYLILHKIVDLALSLIINISFRSKFNATPFKYH